MRKSWLLPFFLSGAAGLIYEVAWSRMLGLVFGTSALAISTVLIVFMGGMSLGSYLLGKVTDKVKAPFLFYGLLEAGIGFLCLFVPILLSNVSEIYKNFYPALQNSFLLLSLVRLALVILVLLPPTFLMGGTFPAFSAGYTRLGEAGKDLGTIYAVNTSGAVVGTLLAGFVLLPNLGLSTTIKIAVGLNLFVFLLSLILPKGEETIRESEALPIVYPPSTATLAMLAIGLSGFSAMALEVAWTRALHMVFGITTYAFTTMLASFLIGLVVGSAIIARFIERVKDLALLLAIVEIAAGFTASLLSRIIDQLPIVFLWLFKYTHNNFFLFYLCQFVICSLVLLIPTSLFGASFPIATRIVLSSKEEFASRVGKVYAYNTLGNILGSFISGFLLIKYLGAGGIITIACLINALAGGIMLKGAIMTPKGRLKELGGVLIAVLIFIAVPIRWNIERLTSGVYLYAPYYLGEGSFSEAVRKMEEREIIYYKDSVTSTITVLRGFQNGVPALALQIDGKTEASSFGDLTTQYMVAHLPLLLHPNPQKVMIIGLASGCTLGAALCHPVNRIDCAEIEPAMLEASRFFKDVNEEYWKDSRARVIIEDGRNYLALTPEKYDCIISEPSNPWISGLGNLFTKEFYEICKDHLTDGGIFALWVPAYITSLEDFKGIIATATSVFPFVTAWNYPPIFADVIVICSNKPFKFSLDEVERKIKDNPRLKNNLSRINIHDVWDFLWGYLLPDETIRMFSQGSPLNTDNLPRIEFSAPKWLYKGINRDVLTELYTLARNPLIPGELKIVKRDTLYHIPLLHYSAKGKIEKTELFIHKEWGWNDGGFWSNSHIYLSLKIDGKTTYLRPKGENNIWR
ncbi:fused MFS/spermidine synthase [bacterium]|nr:fused MFS/spermidine synthase [bacterium]